MIRIKSEEIIFRLNYPNAQSDKLELDYHQKLTLKFQIKDKQSDEYLRAQQAFLRFTNKKSQKEIIYLAEATNGANSQYKVEVVMIINQTKKSNENIVFLFQ
jgi:oligosaccharyltransferase complex subunit delta (ribophorin II)